MSTLLGPVTHLLGPANDLLATAKISVGEHAATVKVLGMTIDLDIVWATLAAAAIVLGLGFWARAKATPGVPGKLQLFFETVVTQVEDLTSSAIGPEGSKYIPLAVTLFLFILTCNWIEIIPSGHNPEWFPAPTADVNLPLAMALVVWIWSIAAGIRKKGLRGYGGHFT